VLGAVWLLISLSGRACPVCTLRFPVERKPLHRFLHNVHKISYAPLMEVATVLVDERVELPFGLVAVPGEVFIAGGHRDSLFYTPLPKVGQKGVKMVPVDANLAVGREEGQPVLKEGQVRDA
jgi:hypothetical protein